MSVPTSVTVVCPPLTVVGATVVIPFQQGQQVAQIKVTNSSQYDLQYSGFGTAGLEWICAGLETMLYAQDTNSGRLTLTPYNNINIQPPTTGVVLVTLYMKGDPAPKGAWPVSIPTQIVSTTVSGATSIVNDNNPATTSIVEATASGSTGSNVSLTNDSILALKSFVSAVLSTYFKTIPSALAGASVIQIGDAPRTAEIMGELLVDGLLSVVGNALVGGTLGVTGLASLVNAAVSGTLGVTGIASFTVAPQLTSKTIQDGAGTLLADWSGAGLKLYGNASSHGEFNYSQVVGDIDWKTTAIGASGITTAASGVVNHTMVVGGSGSTPQNAYVDPFNGVPPGSQTIGIGSFTTTTINVTLGASIQALIHVWQH